MTVLRFGLAFVLATFLVSPTAGAEGSTIRVLLREADSWPTVITSTSGILVRDEERALVAQGNDLVVELNSWYVERAGNLPARLYAERLDGAERRYPSGLTRHWYGGFSSAEEARWEASRIGGWPVRAAIAVRKGEDIVTVHYRAQMTIEPLGGALQLNGAAYRGSFVLSPAGAGVRIVNQVDAEQYLYSVVGAEMSTSWHPEALRAQAVAARTYLRANLRPRGDYDICATETCQVYSGMRTEGPRTIQAVEDTRGLILTYGGRPISALYSANAGGHTESSENVFPNAAPYLRGVPSPYDEQAAKSGAPQSWQWQVTIPEDQLIGLLRRKGATLRSVSRVVETERTSGGRVVGLRFEGPDGALQLTKDEVRWVLGLKSNLVSLSFAPGYYEFIPFADRVGRQRVVGGGATWVADVLENPREMPQERGRRVGWQIYRVPGKLVIVGRGYGHGVGLSQWGAQGMALAGSDFRDILGHYYLGARIEPVP